MSNKEKYEEMIHQAIVNGHHRVSVRTDAVQTKMTTVMADDFTKEGIIFSGKDILNHFDSGSVLIHFDEIRGVVIA